MPLTRKRSSRGAADPGACASRGRPRLGILAFILAGAPALWAFGCASNEGPRAAAQEGGSGAEDSTELETEDPDAEDSEDPEGEPAAPQPLAGPFVWPTSTWVSANDFYSTGRAHTGSADLAAPHYTPIRPARDGRVTRRGFSGTSGWFVQLEHAGTDGYRYSTFYAHLADAPSVQIGQDVSVSQDGGTILGYVSRTGHAASPHIHFTLRKFLPAGGSVRVVIPNLAIGDWVESGQTIPGVYEGVEPIPVAPRQPFRVRVVEPGGLNVYSTTRRVASEVLSVLRVGTDIEVLRTFRGQHEIAIDVDGARRTGWIPQSGTAPTNAGLFGLAIGGRSNVRDEPNGEIIGSIPGGSLLTGFEPNPAGTWYRVQWRCSETESIRNLAGDDAMPFGGCPGVAMDPNRQYAVKYGWVGANVSSVTSDFRAVVRTQGLNVYANRTVDGVQQPNPNARIGAMNVGATITVTETRNGWYKFTFQGQTAWLRGWHTAGRT